MSDKAPIINTKFDNKIEDDAMNTAVDSSTAQSSQDVFNDEMNHIPTNGQVAPNDCDAGLLNSSNLSDKKIENINILSNKKQENGTSEQDYSNSEKGDKSYKEFFASESCDSVCDDDKEKNNNLKNEDISITEFADDKNDIDENNLEVISDVEPSGDCIVVNKTNELDSDYYSKIIQSKKFTFFIKRCFDICASFLGIVVLLPLFIIISFSIALTSKGGVFFKQTRVGKNGKNFKIIKFRTMVKNAEAKGMQITVGKDMRVTKIGKILRATKIDELPQLFNVLFGQMSFVGPRPEVPRYVELYTDVQRSILLIRPGITELASIVYRDENKILAMATDPEKAYVEEVMQKKLEYNLEYLIKLNPLYDLKLIFMTFIAILK